MTESRRMYMKLYSRKHRANHPDKVYVINNRRYQSIYKERRELLDGIKLERGCIDCGYNKAPEALQFDHVIPQEKYRQVGGFLLGNLDKLLAEIAKCVVRCANCHAIKTKKLREYARKTVVNALTRISS